jgi:sugar fermentation stimulation protein A
VVDVEGHKEEVHIRDPGRLEEILYKGNEVLLKKAESPDRKTNWDLIAGKVAKSWVFVNSGYHREISETVLSNEDTGPYGEVDSIVAEKELGDSRIDFLLKEGDERIWIEVKGCTLAREGVALFPDAPTARGRRHVEELRKAIERGDSAGLMVLVFGPDADTFAPNRETDPGFADVYERAREEGLEVHPLRFEFEEDILYYTGEISIYSG